MAITIECDKCGMIIENINDNVNRIVINNQGRELCNDCYTLYNNIFSRVRELESEMINDFFNKNNEV